LQLNVLAYDINDHVPQQKPTKAKPRVKSHPEAGNKPGKTAKMQATKAEKANNQKEKHSRELIKDAQRAAKKKAVQDNEAVEFKDDLPEVSQAFKWALDYAAATASKLTSTQKNLVGKTFLLLHTEFSGIGTPEASCSNQTTAIVIMIC
jgi:hypothetical protein